MVTSMPWMIIKLKYINIPVDQTCPFGNYSNAYNKSHKFDSFLTLILDFYVKVSSPQLDP